MRSTNPPPLATWLLHRFSGSESLTGDLIEQYRNGRSLAWYWRQMLTVIVLGISREIRVLLYAAYGSNPATGVRVVAMAVLLWLMNNLFFAYVEPFILWPMDDLLVGHFGFTRAT